MREWRRRDVVLHWLLGSIICLTGWYTKPESLWTMIMCFYGGWIIGKGIRINNHLNNKQDGNT